MTLLTDTEIMKLEEEEEKDKRLSEEELFEKYFQDNITLDNCIVEKESALDKVIRETREARKRTPPSRYMDGEDFTYTYKKLY